MNDIFEIVGETGKALGEVVVGVAQEVKGAVADLQQMRNANAKAEIEAPAQAQAQAPVRQLTFYEDTHPEHAQENTHDHEF